VWVCALIAFSVFINGCQRTTSAVSVGFFTDEPNPGVAAAIVDVLNGSGLNARLETGFESAEELAAAVEGGAVDIAILGEPRAPNPNVQLLMPLFPQVLHTVYQSALGTPSFAELLQAPALFAGVPDSPGRDLIADLASHHQITDIDTRLLDVIWLGPPDAYFIFGGLLSREARLGFANHRLLSLDQASGFSAEALVLLFPNMRPLTLPAGLYPELAEQDVQTVAVESLLVARASLDEELVYAIVQALNEGAQQLEAAYPLSRESLGRSMADSHHTLALHAGARRFVNKDEPSLLERYAEVFALLATVLLALGTGLTTWLRARRQRRKDRLDGYFLQLQELRGTTGQNAAETRAALSSMEAEVLQG